MPNAVCLIRDDKPYAQSQFIEGFKAIGYHVDVRITRPPNKDDVLLIWNRSGIRHEYAKQYEAANARVLVAENGWIGKTVNGGKFYSLSLNWHNGVGKFYQGDTERLQMLNVDIHPWRKSGNHILLLPSRGIGHPEIAMPRNWPAETVSRLRKITNRHIKVRPHPGDSHADISSDLAGAHAVVTWGSGAAIKAIAAGVPAFYQLKGWIGAQAAKLLENDLEDPFLGDRLPMFNRLAWASWTADEIATGKPYTWLLK